MRFYKFIFCLPSTFSVWGSSSRARPTVWRRRQWVNVFADGGLYCTSVYVYVCVLAQFGCYQHRYEWKGLCCSSTVWLLSTQTWVNVKAPSILLNYHVCVWGVYTCTSFFCCCSFAIWYTEIIDPGRNIHSSFPHQPPPPPPNTHTCMHTQQSPPPLHVYTCTV